MNLQITDEFTNYLEIDFKDITSLDFIYIAQYVSNVIIENVPTDVENEVCKYIFNSVEIELQKRQNILLLSKILIHI